MRYDLYLMLGQPAIDAICSAYEADMEIESPDQLSLGTEQWR